MGKLHILIAGVKASLELVLLDTGQSPEGGFCWQEEEEVKTREYAWLPVCHSHGYHLDDHISIGSRCGWRTRCQAWPCSLSPSPLLSPSLSLVSFVFRYLIIFRLQCPQTFRFRSYWLIVFLLLYIYSQYTVAVPPCIRKGFRSYTHTC
jgi:hypothetical protein